MPAAPDAILELASPVTGLVHIEPGFNVLRVGVGAKIGADIQIMGTGCVVEIGAHCDLTGVIRIHEGVTGRVTIGSHTTATGVAIELHEDGEVKIGHDCMFSYDVRLDTSDVHPIFDRITGDRLNPPRPVEIGDHVWLGARVILLKGARIGDGAVVGAGSVVKGKVPPGVIVSGAPAKIVRRDIEWRRHLAEAIQPSPRPPWWRRWRRPAGPPSSSLLPPRPGGAVFNLDRLSDVEQPFNQKHPRIEFGQPLVLEGFGYDAATKGPAAAVEAHLDGKVFLAHYGDHRADVARELGVPEAERCGFRVEIPPEIARRGTHLLLIRVILADGEAYDESGILPLEIV